MATMRIRTRWGWACPTALVGVLLPTTVGCGWFSDVTCADNRACPAPPGMCVIQPDPLRPDYLDYGPCPPANSDASTDGGAPNDLSQADADLEGSPADPDTVVDSGPLQGGDALADAIEDDADGGGIDGGRDGSEPDATAIDGPSQPCNGTLGPSQDSCVISDTYGVFVSSVNGDDTIGTGTRAAPFRSIARGITAAVATVKRVYVCAAANVSSQYDEHLTIDATVGVFGGFDCETWRLSTGTPTRVAPTTGGPAITVTGAGVTLEDLKIEARDGASPGASSIALFASGAVGLTLRRVELKAGAGGEGGAPDAPVPNYQGPTLRSDGSGATNQDGYDFDPTKPGEGAQACVMLCADRSQTTGGKGGNGTPVPEAGEDGAPQITPPSSESALGKGGQAPKMGALCSDGSAGSDARTASGGAGAVAPGRLAATGWIAAAGTAGQNGTPGQGGGGGGAQAAGGGGGGACGGCGGVGGPGGRGGGSSFALLSYESIIQLEACTLVAGDGGTGGRGANGQVGQPGGQPGISSVGCSGGAGGKGGAGGGGGGGAGGLAIALAYVGPAPTFDGTTKMTVGKAGLGGSPGGAEPLGTDGGVGIGAKGANGFAEKTSVLPGH